MKMMNKFKQLLMMLLATMLITTTHQAWSADAFFDETFGNYQEDLETAKDEGKKGVFVFFHMDECPFCHRMRSTIMTEPDVIKLYKSNFMNVMHDIEGSNEIVDFDGTKGTAQSIAEKKYRVRATPVMMIFDLQGNPIVKYTGPTRTKEEFKWLAEYVIDGSYKTQSFTAYKRARKQAAR
ncbi:thioredoxin [Thiomicrorhabdus immobilis]|uniref:Thioredoxin n=1 Tax=Thiomicrorhabdus immobilis TaxID=2791037 RepID=A0ABM7ME36_9GAMM|nr:thioredoxin fold domain-containing protein [Thiomicrorhabdus immobilis]BCN93668.1 thioredoxin [Thiomicrorhabdus immobilis]